MLIALKLLHTAIWAVMATCVCALPFAAAARRFRLAAWLSAIVLAECAVLALNEFRCPITDWAAQYTSDRSPNFDIYLPAWLARANKPLFGAIFVVSEVFATWTCGRCEGESARLVRTVVSNNRSSREIEMKILVRLVLASLTIVAAAAAQAVSPSEQSSFGVEEKIQRPVPLPPGALQALRESRDQDEMLEQCAESEGLKRSEIPASWFIASAIRLTSKPSVSLVVRGDSQCLAGAHITQFWILKSSKQGNYRILFRGRGDGLDVLMTKTNEYRDVELMIVTQAGANIDKVRFRYADGRYRISGHSVEHN